MKTVDTKGGEHPLTKDLGAAWGQFVADLQRFGWGFLWIGTGLWLASAVRIERFVMDFAETLERRRPQLDSVSPTHWYNRSVSGAWSSLIRVARWVEPAVKAWRRLATRVDCALKQRLAKKSL